MIHIQLCGRVTDKKIFSRPISGNKTSFFWPKRQTADIFKRVYLFIYSFTMRDTMQLNFVTRKTKNKQNYTDGQII